MILLMVFLIISSIGFCLSIRAAICSYKQYFRLFYFKGTLKDGLNKLFAIDFMQANIAWFFACFIIICLYILFN